MIWTRGNIMLGYEALEEGNVRITHIMDRYTGIYAILLKEEDECRYLFTMMQAIDTVLVLGGVT